MDNKDVLKKRQQVIYRGQLDDGSTLSEGEVGKLRCPSTT